ncbi:unnamed protein product [Somion occarium]|uniref:Uncharacterized protein n=1 Tax=Somion occarium TaxID=3059160 RepID=A0ABP1CUM2_9APHY
MHNNVRIMNSSFRHAKVQAKPRTQHKQQTENHKKPVNGRQGMNYSSVSFSDFFLITLTGDKSLALVQQKIHKNKRTITRNLTGRQPTIWEHGDNLQTQYNLPSTLIAHNSIRALQNAEKMTLIPTLTPRNTLTLTSSHSRSGTSHYSSTPNPISAPSSGLLTYISSPADATLHLLRSVSLAPKVPVYLRLRGEDGTMSTLRIEKQKINLPHATTLFSHSSFAFGNPSSAMTRSSSSIAFWRC